MTKRNIILVEFHNGTNIPFGSIAAIFEMFDRQALGISQSSLYKYNIEPGKDYKNKICTIRKSELHIKKGNRCEHMKKKIEI